MQRQYGSSLFEIILLSTEKDRVKSMLMRFIHKGRYLSPKLIDKYVNERDRNRIAKSFEVLSKSSLVDGISRWDNDVGIK